MRLTLAHGEVRSLERGDAASIARHANNRRVWQNLRDRFPHPYSERDARAFIADARRRTPEVTFAIVVDGEASGTIGVMPNVDVDRVSAELGYWLGEAHWGRGIMTEAVRAVTAYAVESFALTRIYATPFADNLASCRVLEKAGYVLEGRLRRAAIKDGRVIDTCLYGFIV